MSDPVSILSKTPPSKFIHNVRAANNRVAELEAQLAARPVGLPAPSATVPASAITARPAAPVISTAVLLRSYRNIDKTDSSLNNLTPINAETRSKIAAKCWCERLTYPGSAADFAALDTSNLRRHVSDADFPGLNRSATALRQQMFNSAIRQNTK